MRAGAWLRLGARRGKGAIMGPPEAADPETGERWKAAAGRNCYWTNTDINLSPLAEY